MNERMKEGIMRSERCHAEGSKVAACPEFTSGRHLQRTLTLTFTLSKLREIPPPFGCRNDKSMSCRGNPDSYRENKASQF